MLTFEEGPHLYRWHGKPVPSVTQVLGQLTSYDRIPAESLKRARQKGVAVHRTVELHAKDDLDEETLPEWLRPPLAAFKQFVADTGFRIVESERRVFHPTYGYAGTADLFGTIRVKRGRSEVEQTACVDLKRSLYAGRAIGLQLIGYVKARETEPGSERIQRRFALVLSETGKYALTEFDDPSDFTNFLACLTVHRLKENTNV